MLHKAETEVRNEDLAKQALELPFVEPDPKMEVHKLPVDLSSSPCGQEWVRWIFPSETPRYKENSALNERQIIDLPGSSYQA